MFILSREATLSLGPSHAGAGSNTLPLVRRESAGSMFTLRGCGVHPFQQLQSVQLDGVALDEVPYPADVPFRPSVPAGSFATRKAQPNGTALVPPGTYSATR